jgi:cyclophilin family peptidyl-prolyl cis-trans isomerase
MSSSVFQGIAVSFGESLPAIAPPITAASTASNALRFPWPEAASRVLPDVKTKETPMADIKDPENTIILTLRDGEVVIELLADVAPKHAERMKQLARDKAYDNVAFHRVIDGFMAQTGDVENANMASPNYNPRRAGTGGSQYPDLPAEFSKLPHDRGTLGAARSQNPNSANSQFFINFKDNHFLNNQYTVYGRVISGMEHVDKIAKGEPPANPDRMISVRVAADVA